MSFVLTFFAWATLAVAGDPYAAKDLKFWAEWDLQCYESSLALRAEPKAKASTFCAAYRKRDPQDSERAIDFLMSDRHMLAVLANAFQADRLDHREAGFRILQSYPCRDAVWCADMVRRLDSELRSVERAWAKQYPNLLQSAVKVKERIAAELAKLPPQNEAAGVCRNGDLAAYWLGIAFTGHCPLKDSGVLPKPVINHAAFVSDLGMQSHQILLSSSLLLAVEYGEPCGKRWDVTIRCEASGTVERKFSCEVVDSGKQHWGEGLPAVTCSPK
jgi:hypothetical protein